MASKKRMELVEVIEMIKDMRYVDKLRDTIWQAIEDTTQEMVDDDTVECDSGALIEMALEELIYEVHYSGKDVSNRIQEYADRYQEEEE